MAGSGSATIEVGHAGPRRPSGVGRCAGPARVVPRGNGGLSRSSRISSDPRHREIGDVAHLMVRGRSGALGERHEASGQRRRSPRHRGMRRSRRFHRHRGRNRGAPPWLAVRHCGRRIAVRPDPALQSRPRGRPVLSPARAARVVRCDASLCASVCDRHPARLLLFPHRPHDIRIGWERPGGDRGLRGHPEPEPAGAVRGGLPADVRPLVVRRALPAAPAPARGIERGSPGVSRPRPGGARGGRPRSMADSNAASPAGHGRRAHRHSARAAPLHRGDPDRAGGRLRLCSARPSHARGPAGPGCDERELRARARPPGDRGRAEDSREHEGGHGPARAGAARTPGRGVVSAAIGGARRQPGPRPRRPRLREFLPAAGQHRRGRDAPANPAS